MDRPEIMAERKRNGFVSVADVIRKEGLVQSAKNFLAMGLSVEQVSKGTGLSIAEIQKHCL